MVPLLAFPQTLHGFVIERIDGKVKSADSLYRDDLSAQEQPRGFSEYLVGLCFDYFSLAVCQPDSRPARSAGNRLGVKTPVANIRILNTSARNWCSL